MTALYKGSIFDLDPTDILFRDLFNSESFYKPLCEVKRISYPLDVKVTDDGLELHVAAVGLDKEDVSVEVKEGTLYVSHVKKEEEKNDNDEFVYRGITRKAFSFSWKLDGFDSSKIDATLDKGILKIVIPRLEEAKPKKINVK